MQYIYSYLLAIIYFKYMLNVCCKWWSSIKCIKKLKTIFKMYYGQENTCYRQQMKFSSNLNVFSWFQIYGVENKFVKALY